mmetsp:Transcript_1028/g.1921  ORF Transcript_1028/g.1921 Transcript_1028/m.1921 type:complete len:442 (+) Transcript_1028:460-1785(+)
MPTSTAKLAGPISAAQLPVILDSSLSHIGLLLNVIASLRRFGLSNFLVVTYDSDANDAIQALGLTTVFDQELINTLTKLKNRPGCRDAWFLPMAVRTQLFADLLHLGVAFWWSDTDVSYRMDVPFSLRKMDAEFVFGFALDAPDKLTEFFNPVIEGESTRVAVLSGCGGFRATPRVREMFQDYYTQAALPSMCQALGYDTSAMGRFLQFNGFKLRWLRDDQGNFDDVRLVGSWRGINFLGYRELTQRRQVGLSGDDQDAEIPIIHAAGGTRSMPRGDLSPAEAAALGKELCLRWMDGWHLTPLWRETRAVLVGMGHRSLRQVLAELDPSLVDPPIKCSVLLRHFALGVTFDASRLDRTSEEPVVSCRVFLDNELVAWRDDVSGVVHLPLPEVGPHAATVVAITEEGIPLRESTVQFQITPSDALQVHSLAGGEESSYTKTL